jgi:hypothetical protein
MFTFLWRMFPSERSSLLIQMTHAISPSLEGHSIFDHRKKRRPAPRMTQLSLFVPSAFGDSGFTKDSKCAIEAGFRGRFRCHVFRSPEDFYAERIVVVDALERLQEAGQVDDTFAG